MEWRELESFLTLAEELHFGRTAERLFLSRARVSQNIGAFERRIGARLFVRSSRQVSLTAIGRQLVADLEGHHRGIQEAVAKARDTARGVGARLCAGYSGPWSAELLHRAAARFGFDHLGCRIEVREVHLSDPFAALRAGELDVQLTELPVREPDLSVSRALISQRRCVVVPAGHPFTRRDAVSVEDLAGETHVVFGGPPDYQREYFWPTTTPSGRPIPHSGPVVYWQDALSMVAAGRGVTVAAEAAARYYSRPDLAYVPVHDGPPIEYALVWRTADASGLLLDFIREAEAQAGG